MPRSRSLGRGGRSDKSAMIWERGDRDVTMHVSSSEDPLQLQRSLCNFGSSSSKPWRSLAMAPRDGYLFPRLQAEGCLLISENTCREERVIPLPPGQGHLVPYHASHGSRPAGPARMRQFPTECPLVLQSLVPPLGVHQPPTRPADAAPLLPVPNHRLLAVIPSQGRLQLGLRTAAARDPTQ